MKTGKGPRGKRWWAGTACWAGLIFFLSSRQSFPAPSPFPGFDKLVHMALFGTLCLLLFRALASSRRRTPFHATALLSVLLAFFYGITDEMHQAFVPGRSCDAFDALADLAGAILTAAILFRLPSFRK